MKMKKKKWFWWLLVSRIVSKLLASKLTALGFRRQSLVLQRSKEEAAEEISFSLNPPLPQNHARYIHHIQGCERSFNSQFGLRVHVHNKNNK